LEKLHNGGMTNFKIKSLLIVMQNDNLICLDEGYFKLGCKAATPRPLPDSVREYTLAKVKINAYITTLGEEYYNKNSLSKYDKVIKWGKNNLLIALIAILLLVFGSIEGTLRGFKDIKEIFGPKIITIDSETRQNKLIDSLNKSKKQTDSINNLKIMDSIQRIKAYTLESVSRANQKHDRKDIKTMPPPSKPTFPRFDSIPSDRPVQEGGTVVRLIVDKRKVDTTARYHLTSYYPFYKNHINECNSTHDNKYEYVVNFTLLQNDTTITINGSSMIYVKTPASNKIQDAAPLAIDMIIPGNKFKNGVNLELKIVNGDAYYYSPCDHNKHESLMFRKGGYIKLEKIE